MALKEKIGREPIRDRKFVMPFGKHKGESIADLMEIDPHYLIWVHENTDLELHADLYDEAAGSLEEWHREKLYHEFDHYKD